MPPEVRRFPDPESVARAAAAEIALSIDGNCRESGGLATTSIVLAGGTTPRRAYEILAREHASLPWERVHVFWGDERCVPPDHPDSNYAAARAALLDHVPVQPKHIHRIRGELGAHAAAAEYERELHAYLDPWNEFDLVILGMGEDGHTASLFPGSPALHETERWVVPVETEAKAPRWRVSLTLPELSASQEVMFVVTGAGKRAVLQQILADPEAARMRFPAAAIDPENGNVKWFADAAALGDVR